MSASLVQHSFESRCISSLEKVFADEELAAPHVMQGTALRGEVHAFQIAYRSSWTKKRLQATVKSPLEASISLRSVGLVPSEFPVHPDHDTQVLRATPGLYPDPLYPYDEAGITAVGGQWRSLWVTVALPENVGAGNYPIRILLADPDGEALAEELYELEIIDASLPEQRLLHTEWFHADCLANYYGVEVFSEAHWKLIDAYVETAVRYGMNMILTPLFTPPLDTAVGGERMTVQLVEVRVDAVGTYAFDFSRLQRWIKLCRARGMRYFEFSHLFTQWGAKHAPKIMAWVEGKLVRLFGWETDAAGEAYRDFLDQFLPRLVEFLREQGIKQHESYFHISDEPHKEHLAAYREASRIVSIHLEGFPRIDALSDVSFYEHGLVPNPIPASNHLEPFLERGIDDLWTYYCCSQYKEVANRFFCFPSARNRVLGFQLYKFRIAGFLHWGYNFWNSQQSTRAIDPYRITDSDCAFPSGDPFVVYPGEDGPIVSLRLEVFREALQDLRALELLERLIGRERTLSILEEGLAEPLTFRRFPVDAAWLLTKREEINQQIAKYHSKEVPLLE